MTATSNSDQRSYKATIPSIERHVSEIQAGIRREENFQRVFERYYAVIRRFFAKRGFPMEESQDLAQEVFLRIFRSIDAYRSDGPFEGWLFQVAANVYRNQLRDHQAIKRQAQEDTLENFLGEVSIVAGEGNALGGSSHAPSHEPHLDKERAEVLNRALSELPEQMRRCLVLRIHQDLKYREIAAVMRISIETVKAHLYQARNRLKNELDGYFDEPEEGES